MYIQDVYTEEKLHFVTKSFTFSRSSGNIDIYIYNDIGRLYLLYKIFDF